MNYKHHICKDASRIVLFRNGASFVDCDKTVLCVVFYMFMLCLFVKVIVFYRLSLL